MSFIRHSGCLLAGVHKSRRKKIGDGKRKPSTHITNVKWQQVVSANKLTIHHNTQAKVAIP